jgi:hypothetical protein
MSQYPVSIVCSLHEPPYTQVKGSGSLGTLDWLSQRLTPLTAPLLPPLPFPRVLLRTCVAEYTAPCVRIHMRSRRDLLLVYCYVRRLV